MGVLSVAECGVRRGSCCILVLLWLVLTVLTKEVGCLKKEEDVTSKSHHDYCVVGAGPAGLQMGYFLHQAKRDYVIFERANNSGERATNFR